MLRIQWVSYACNLSGCALTHEQQDNGKKSHHQNNNPKKPGVFETQLDGTETKKGSVIQSCFAKAQNEQNEFVDLFGGLISLFFFFGNKVLFLLGKC